MTFLGPTLTKGFLQVRITEREGKRLAERLKGHIDNDVWEKRTEPPENWNAPLPQYLTYRSDESYLKRYKLQQESPTINGAKELRVARFNGYMNQVGCTIM